MRSFEIFGSDPGFEGQEERHIEFILFLPSLARQLPDRGSHARILGMLLRPKCVFPLLVRLFLRDNCPRCRRKRDNQYRRQNLDVSALSRSRGAMFLSATLLLGCQFLRHA